MAHMGKRGLTDDEIGDGGGDWFWGRKGDGDSRLLEQRGWKHWVEREETNPTAVTAWRRSFDDGTTGDENLQWPMVSSAESGEMGTILVVTSWGFGSGDRGKEKDVEGALIKSSDGRIGVEHGQRCRDGHRHGMKS